MPISLQPRRLVFWPPSLKQRGWVAARNSNPASPLPCVLYAATPPGRLAVAPVSTSSGGKGEEIPWVSFAGLARLNRADPQRVKALWFGRQIPEFSTFYEFAPVHVGPYTTNS